MTKEEIARELQTITRTLEQRVEIWRVVLAPNGAIVKRIYRGSFKSGG